MLENVLKGIPIVLGWVFTLIIVLCILALVVTYPREAIWTSFGLCVFIIIAGFVGNRK